MNVHRPVSSGGFFYFLATARAADRGGVIGPSFSGGIGLHLRADGGKKAGGSAGNDGRRTFYRLILPDKKDLAG